jgi:hypothetical protein
MHALAASLEKALGVYCSWQDLRESRKRTRVKVPGLRLVTEQTV